MIMEESLVSFETAKLAKKKGFNEPSKFLFDFVGKEYPEQTKTFWNTKPHINGGELISRPTQSLLQKWLREFHQMHIQLWYVDEIIGFQCSITNMKTNTELIDSIYNINYEQGFEIGLQEALNLI